MENTRRHAGKQRRYFFLFCLCMAFVFMNGCAYRNVQTQSQRAFKDATVFFEQGSYTASLRMYEQILNEHPQMGDQALFKMGMVYAFSSNDQKDYQKSQACFERLIRDYPESTLHFDSMMMLFYIGNLASDAKRYLSQQKQIELLNKALQDKQNAIFELEQRLDTLDTKLNASLQGSVDEILIEKKERRMSLFSKGRLYKVYKIALGANPEGPKVKQGDNKTPEGVYFIDSRKDDSRFHLALHISYPNERDVKRAKRLGVCPGGDIMIHGIKNGYSWVGDAHTKTDWTQGCIAVTNDEIEEISNLVTIGTKVVIRP